MEFLVQIVVDLPEAIADHEREALLAAERRRGRELIADGTIEHIWRVAGTRSNVGIWQATDGNELHVALSSLPLFPWLQITVVPLATHPLLEDPDPRSS